MTKCFKVWYEQEFEHPDDIDIVSEQGIVNYANECWVDGRIAEQTLKVYLEKHDTKPTTKEDAIELLELDGYRVDEYDIYE